MNREVIVKPIQSIPRPGSKEDHLPSGIAEMKVGEALRNLAGRFAEVSGEELFAEVASYLADALDIKFAYLGELNETADRVTVLGSSAWQDGLDFPAGYDLKDTPCELTIDNSICYVAADVQEAFPNDAGLKKVNAQSYMGIPLSDKDGRHIGLIALLHDQSLPHPEIAESLLSIFSPRISAEIRRKRVEESLRDSESRYSRVLDNVPVCIHEMNLQGEVLNMNDAGLKMLGVNKEANVLGMNFRSVIGAGDIERIEKLWQKAVQGESAEYEFQTVGLQPNCMFAASFVPITDDDGVVTRVLGVTRDISERKRIEAELDKHRQHLEELVEHRTRQLAEAQRQAEAASKAKSTFLAVMSHEIRTPLNAIIGINHLLRQSEHTAQQSKWFGHISNSAEHLLSIINNILDLSKIEAGKLTMDRAEFDLSQVLEQAANQFDEQLDLSNLAIRVESAGVPRKFAGDATRLSQALLNYVSNAVKFSSNGIIEIRVTAPEQTAHNALLRFEVEDHGIGIEPERLEHLFNAFEQADASTTREYGGTGLGLAVTRQLAQLMGGEAGAISTPGQGSTFWFTVRLDLVADTASERKRTGDPGERLRANHQGAHILLAEDNPINCEVAVSMLTSAGLLVDTVGTGIEAVEKAATGHYQLVLMDMRMPEMDGLQATREIRAIPGLGKLPILAMTANVFSDDRAACTEAGMNDFVAKPVKATKLFSIVEKWLARAD